MKIEVCVGFEGILELVCEHGRLMLAFACRGVERSIIMDLVVDLENTPTLEEDMAAFLDKTEEEVKLARK